MVRNTLVIHSNKEVEVIRDYIYTANGIYTIKVADKVFYIKYDGRKDLNEAKIILLDEKGSEVLIIGTTPRLNGETTKKNFIRNVFISYMVGTNNMQIN